MREYGLIHIHCGMRKIIFGYDYYDACRRSNTDPKLWEVDYSEYAD